MCLLKLAVFQVRGFIYFINFREEDLREGRG